MCIYELMAEDSAVNYWEVRCFYSDHNPPRLSCCPLLHLHHALCSDFDCVLPCFYPLNPSWVYPDDQKYGQVAFDTNQKAVLTSCILRYKPVLPSSGSNTPANARGKAPPQQEQGFISCCFSFTIRRDPYGIPTLIVGNFIRC